MENFRDLPLEVRLSAYIDGQLSDEDKRELDALLATDPNARELLDLLKAGSDFGNDAFAEMLREPVPLDLVRSIKTRTASQGGGFAPQPANNNSRISFLRFVPQAIAASAVLLLAGGYSGYFIGTKQAMQAPVEISETSGLEAPAGSQGKTRELKLSFDAPTASNVAAIALSSVADVHDVYAKQTGRLVEVPASEAAQLQTWLSASTGVNFQIPDLKAEGLTFQGGRLVPIDGNPAGALYYTNAKGEVVALYFAKGKIPAGETAEGTHDYVAGSKGDTAWVVAGPGGEAGLKDIAGKASAAL